MAIETLIGFAGDDDDQNNRKSGGLNPEFMKKFYEYLSKCYPPWPTDEPGMREEMTRIWQTVEAAIHHIEPTPTLPPLLDRSTFRPLDIELSPDIKRQFFSNKDMFHFIMT